MKFLSKAGVLLAVALLLFGCLNQPKVTDSSSVFIKTDKLEYPIYGVVDFELYNNLNESIWFVEQLDGCSSGPFYVNRSDGQIFYGPRGSIAACIVEHTRVGEVVSNSSQRFAWDLNEYLVNTHYVFGFPNLLPGTHTISMQYYRNLSNIQVTLLNSAGYIQNVTEEEQRRQRADFNSGKNVQRGEVYSNPFRIVLCC